MNLKVFVTGAAGLLGGRIVHHLPSDFKVVAGHHLQQGQLDAGVKSIQVDLTDRQAVEQLLRDYKFNIVINCAGASDVDRCELDNGYAIQSNLVLVRNLIERIHKYPCRLLHVSSDYVFSAGPASESDTPDPINFYGKTKLMAEEAIRNAQIDATIIRVCALYSTDLKAPKNIYRSIANSILKGNPYPAADDLFSNPTEVNDLAQAICQLPSLSNLPSAIHLAAPEYLSRYEFALRVAVKLGIDEGIVKRSTRSELNLPAARPQFAGLKSGLAFSILERNLETASEVLLKPR